MAAASRGDAESEGSKTSACWNRRVGISMGSLCRNGQFPKVPHVLLRRFDVLGKSDFPLVGSLSRRYYWEKPHRPARGGSATVQVLRCSWNCGSARITAAASRGDAESEGSKTSACWNRRAGISMGSLCRNGQFPKVPHVLLRRFDILGKSDFPLVGSLSRRYCREKPHQPARKECAAPPARVKFYD